MLKEEQRSSAIGIPCEKVNTVRILEGQIWSTVGIGIRLREELRSRRLRIPSNKLGYKMAHGGETLYRRYLRNGFHVVCMQASVLAKGVERKWRGVSDTTVRRGTVACIYVCVLWRAMRGDGCFGSSSCTCAAAAAARLVGKAESAQEAAGNGPRGCSAPRRMCPMPRRTKEIECRGVRLGLWPVEPAVLYVDLDIED
jgi:hypothetical protein